MNINALRKPPKDFPDDGPIFEPQIPDVPAVVQDAQFVSQSVPASMIAGQSYDVSVTMRNTGTNTWTAPTAHRLGSQNPQDNTTWGLGRVDVPGALTPGQDAAFRFRVTAPTTPGN